MTPDKLVPFDYQKEYHKTDIHSKNMNSTLCLPSTMQSYSLAIEFVRHWFLSKFKDNPFKTVYIDGKNIFDEMRRYTKKDFIKKPKPSLAIIPAVDFSFNNDNIDMYAFGLNLYRPRGMFKDSFFKDPVRNVHLGIAMETLLVNFSFRIRVETRGQQIDLFKYIQLAHRVGNQYTQDVDLDFHIPYGLIVQMAEDLGFEVDYCSNETYPRIKNIHKFLSYLNTHSSLPFLYKFRAENGKNEFFLRMNDMPVNISPTDISADDGEREGQILNNFNIEMSVELRFPAPKMYAYYSSNEHKITTVYQAFNQVNGMLTSAYTFKGTPIPNVNKRGWGLWLSTTYESDNLEDKFTIDFSPLFEGELKAYTESCLYQGMSPFIFCEILLINGGEHIFGSMDWETMTFTSKNPVRSLSTFIGVYLDKEYINNYLIDTGGGQGNRLQVSIKDKS